MRNLDITDTRAKLDLYGRTGLISTAEGEQMFRLEGEKERRESMLPASLRLTV
jgi:argininosuccinate synthase